MSKSSLNSLLNQGLDSFTHCCFGRNQAYQRAPKLHLPRMQLHGFKQESWIVHHHTRADWTNALSTAHSCLGPSRVGSPYRPPSQGTNPPVTRLAWYFVELTEVDPLPVLPLPPAPAGPRASSTGCKRETNRDVSHRPLLWAEPVPAVCFHLPGRKWGPTPPCRPALAVSSRCCCPPED